MTAVPAMDDRHDAFPIRTVAEQTGLSPDLIRIWERRYGVVRPIRGPRGARLYTREDIAHLRSLAAAVASGRTIGDVAGLAAPALAALVAPMERSHGSSAEGVLPRLLDALERFDAGAIDRMLGDALVALGTGAFARQVARPLLVEIGVRTSDGRLTIADEHLISGLMRNLLAGIMRTRRQAERGDVLLATPSGERHEFGLLLAALHVVEAGLGVCYLGVDIPAADIASAARRAAVRIVGIGVVDSGNRERAVAELRDIERTVPPATQLWLGGADAAATAQALTSSRFELLDRAEALDRAARRAGGRGHAEW